MLDHHKEVHAFETEPLSEELLTLELPASEIVNVTSVHEDKPPTRFKPLWKSMEIDSGASCNVFPKKHLAENKEIHKTNKVLTTYNKALFFFAWNSSSRHA